MSSIRTSLIAAAENYANKFGNKFNRMTVLFTNVCTIDNKHYIVPEWYVVDYRNRGLTHYRKYLLPQTIANNLKAKKHYIEINKNQYKIIKNHNDIDYWILTVKYNYIGESNDEEINGNRVEVYSEKLTRVNNPEIEQLLWRIIKRNKKFGYNITDEFVEEPKYRIEYEDNYYLDCEEEIIMNRHNANKDVKEFKM